MTQQVPQRLQHLPVSERPAEGHQADIFSVQPLVPLLPLPANASPAANREAGISDLLRILARVVRSALIGDALSRSKLSLPSRPVNVSNSTECVISAKIYVI